MAGPGDGTGKMVTQIRSIKARVKNPSFLAHLPTRFHFLKLNVTFLGRSLKL